MAGGLDSASWAYAVVSITAVTYPFEWCDRPMAGLGLAVLAIGAFAIGSAVAYSGDWSPAVGPSLRGLLEVGLSRLSFVLIRSQVRAVDQLTERVAARRREAAVAAARRAAEREYLATLHDTASTTLLMVALGTREESQEEMRERARRDLKELTTFSGPDGSLVDLGSLLATAVRQPGLRVHGEIGPLPFGLLAYAVRRVAVRASRAAADEERIRTGEAVAGHTHDDRRRRYAELRGTAVPLLVGLGEGSLDPSDRDVRRRCAREAARMRRLFAEGDDVADRLLHELRAVIDVAERGEITVQLAVRGEPRDVPRPVRRELVDAVTVVLTAATSSVRVTVVRAPEQVRVSAVGATSGEPPAGPGGGQVEVNRVVKGKRLWIEAVWRS